MKQIQGTHTMIHAHLEIDTAELSFPLTEIRTCLRTSLTFVWVAELVRDNNHYYTSRYVSVNVLFSLHWSNHPLHSHSRLAFLEFQQPVLI